MIRFRWIDPRRSFAARVTFVIVSLILLTLAGATLVTLRVARTNLTEQAGHTFEGHAENLSELVQLYSDQQRKRTSAARRCNSARTGGSRPQRHVYGR